MTEPATLTDQILDRNAVLLLANKGEPVTLVGCELDEVDLSDMILNGWGFDQCLFRKTKFVGARLERAGSETEAYLRLPPATLDSRVTEMLEEQVAQTDYRLKKQAKRLLGLLAGLQEIRRGAAEARGKSGR